MKLKGLKQQEGVKSIQIETDTKMKKENFVVISQIGEITGQKASKNISKEMIFLHTQVTYRQKITFFHKLVSGKTGEVIDKEVPRRSVTFSVLDQSDCITSATRVVLFNQEKSLSLEIPPHFLKLGIPKRGIKNLLCIAMYINNNFFSIHDTGFG